MPDSTVPRSKRQAWVPYVLLFLFAAPFVLSWWMINFTQLGRDGGAYSHGDLVRPPRVVPDRPLLDALADTRSRHLYGKWNIVYLANISCDPRCEQRLYMMRQIWLAMGRDSERLQRVLLLVDTVNRAAVQRRLQPYPGQLLALINPEDSAALVGIFTLAKGDLPLDAGRLYLIDPRGNLMMSYPPDTDPMGIIKDLDRLLKYSGIG